MPQNDHMDLYRKRFGRRFDHEEKMRKKEARSVKEIAAKAKNLHGIKGKLFAKERYKEKVRMRKTIKAHEEKEATAKDEKEKPELRFGRSPLEIKSPLKPHQ